MLKNTLDFVKILIKIERRFSCLGGVSGRSFRPAYRRTAMITGEPTGKSSNAYRDKRKHLAPAVAGLPFCPQVVNRCHHGGLADGAEFVRIGVNRAVKGLFGAFC